MVYGGILGLADELQITKFTFHIPVNQTWNVEVFVVYIFENDVTHYLESSDAMTSILNLLLIEYWIVYFVNEKNYFLEKNNILLFVWSSLKINWIL